jgi:hypothetical protein
LTQRNALGFFGIDNPVFFAVLTWSYGSRERPRGKFAIRQNIRHSH